VPKLLVANGVPISIGAAAADQSDDGTRAVGIAAMTDEKDALMPLPKFASTRTDGAHIGSRIKQLVDLMLDGVPWRKAADQLGISRRVAERALQKPHVRAFMRSKKIQTIEELAMTIPVRLHELMLQNNNPNAAVRAGTALYGLASEELTARRLALTGTPTPGLTIQIVSATPQPAPPMTTIEHAPQLIERADDE
jgi:hypothetical protein